MSTGTSPPICLLFAGWLSRCLLLLCLCLASPLVPQWPHTSILDPPSLFMLAGCGIASYPTAPTSQFCHITTSWRGCPTVVQPHNVQLAPLNKEDFVVVANVQTVGIQEFRPNFLPSNYCMPRLVACALVCVFACVPPSRPALVSHPSSFAANPPPQANAMQARFHPAAQPSEHYNAPHGDQHQ